MHGYQDRLKGLKQYKLLASLKAYFTCPEKRQTSQSHRQIDWTDVLLRTGNIMREENSNMAREIYT